MAYEDIRMEPDSELTRDLMMEYTNTMLKGDERETVMEIGQTQFSERDKVKRAVKEVIKIDITSAMMESSSHKRDTMAVTNEYEWKDVGRCIQSAGTVNGQKLVSNKQSIQQDMKYKIESTQTT